MSARLPFNINAAHFVDPGHVEIIGERQDSKGRTVNIHRSSTLGLQLGSMEIAVGRVSAHMLTRAREDGSPAARKYTEEQSRQDAEDFATSRLTQLMGPASDVRRGEGKPYMFVASKGEELIPSQQTLDIGARVGQYNIRALTGQAQWTNLEDLATLQNADFVGDVGDYKAHWCGIAKRISIPETWSEKFTRVNTDQERTNAAMMALDDFQEQASAWGDSTKGVTGAFTMGNASIGLSGPAFSTGVSATDMLLVLGTMERHFQNGNQDRLPWGGVIASADVVAMKNTFFTGTATSAWMIAESMYPWLKNMKQSRALELGNQAGTASRWVLVGLDPDHLHNEVTDTMVFGPFVKDLVTYFYMVRRLGGIVAKMPEMVNYFDFTVS
jgi:hypothetical protein